MVREEPLSNQELMRRLVHAGPQDGLWIDFLSRFQTSVRLAVFRSLKAEAGRNPDLYSALPVEIVDDLTQEVFVRLLEGGRKALINFKARNENSVYTYLHTIAVNLARDHFKKLLAKKSPRVALSIDEPLSSEQASGEGVTTLGEVIAVTSETPERTAEARQWRERLKAQIDQAAPGPASARDRLIFRLYFEEGLTVEEIVALPNIELKRSGVEKRIKKIREVLQQERPGGRQLQEPTPG